MATLRNKPIATASCCHDVVEAKERKFWEKMKHQNSDDTLVMVMVIAVDMRFDHVSARARHSTAATCYLHLHLHSASTSSLSRP